MTTTADLKALERRLYEIPAGHAADLAATLFVRLECEVREHADAKHRLAVSVANGATDGAIVAKMREYFVGLGWMGPNGSVLAGFERLVRLASKQERRRAAVARMTLALHEAKAHRKALEKRLRALEQAAAAEVQP